MLLKGQVRVNDGPSIFRESFISTGVSPSQSSYLEGVCSYDKSLSFHSIYG